MFDARPEDREKFAVWIQEIVPDHKTGPDGTLIEDDKIYLGKRGAANYQQIYSVSRLKKDNPALWDYLRPVYEGWKKDRTIPRIGMMLDAWGTATKGQVKACNDLGLFTVEDIAEATDTIRQKLGIGASELIAKAKAFVANKESASAAAKIADLEKIVADQTKALEEARETMNQLAAEAGRKVRQKPQREAA